MKYPIGIDDQPTYVSADGHDYDPSAQMPALQEIDFSGDAEARAELGQLSIPIAMLEAIIRATEALEKAGDV